MQSCQRTIWKQITTAGQIRYYAVGLYAILSKNNLKANHNSFLFANSSDKTVCNLVKEQSESKSQHISALAVISEDCMQSCQRTIWKQITTIYKKIESESELYAILSKNNLKANHNSGQRRNLKTRTVCNLVKEQSESKSQQVDVSCWRSYTVCNLVKEQSESKSQRFRWDWSKLSNCMQSCQRTIWKQITTELHSIRI